MPNQSSHQIVPKHAWLVWLLAILLASCTPGSTPAQSNETAPFQRPLNFPRYSQPLYENSAEWLKPFAFLPVRRPLGGGWNGEIRMDSFLNFHEAPLKFTLVLYPPSGSAPNAGDNSNSPNSPNLPNSISNMVKVEILDGGNGIGSGRIRASASMRPVAISPDGEWHWTTTFASIDPLQAASWSRELTVRVSLSGADLPETSLTGSFDFTKSIASVAGSKQAFINDADLVIPLKLTLAEGRPGFFKVTANLFTTDGKPVAHLTSRQRLEAKEGTSPIMPMLACASVFQHRQTEGPYVLRDIILIRMPDKLGGQKAYGDASGFNVEIPNQPLDTFTSKKCVGSGVKQKWNTVRELIKNLPPDAGQQ